jgi:hypothetical protein
MATLTLNIMAEPATTRITATSYADKCHITPWRWVRLHRVDVRQPVTLTRVMQCRERVGLHRVDVR